MLKEKKGHIVDPREMENHKVKMQLVACYGEDASKSIEMIVFPMESVITFEVVQDREVVSHFTDLGKAILMYNGIGA